MFRFLLSLFFFILLSPFFFLSFSFLQWRLCCVMLHTDSRRLTQARRPGPIPPPATDPGNGIRRSPMLIISPPGQCTWQRCAVWMAPCHEPAGADVKKTGRRDGEGLKKNRNTVSPLRSKSRANCWKAHSGVECAFLWIVNPQLNRAPGRAQMSAFTDSVSVSLWGDSQYSVFVQNGTGLGLFLSDSLHEAAKDASTPKAKIFFCCLVASLWISLSLPH